MEDIISERFGFILVTQLELVTYCTYLRSRQRRNIYILFGVIDQSGPPESCLFDNRYMFFLFHFRLPRSHHTAGRCRRGCDDNSLHIPVLHHLLPVPLLLLASTMMQRDKPYYVLATELKKLEA